MRTGKVIVMRTSDIMFVSLLIHGYSDVLAILNYDYKFIDILWPAAGENFQKLLSSERISLTELTVKYLNFPAASGGYISLIS